MNILNETELQQANGGWIASLFKATLKLGSVGAAGYYVGKTTESIVANTNATNELNQSTDQVHRTTDLIREFNDKRDAA